MRKARARGSLTIGAATVAMTMGSQAGKKNGKKGVGLAREVGPKHIGVSERGYVTCLLSPEI